MIHLAGGFCPVGGYPGLPTLGKISSRKSWTSRTKGHSHIEASPNIGIDLLFVFVFLSCFKWPQLAWGETVAYLSISSSVVKGVVWKRIGKRWEALDYWCAYRILEWWSTLPNVPLCLCIGFKMSALNTGSSYILVFYQAAPSEITDS